MRAALHVADDDDDDDDDDEQHEHDGRHDACFCLLKRLYMCVVDGGRVLLYCDEIERGARSYACCCRNGCTPIHRAAAKGQISTVELLISKNADVTVPDK